MTITIGALAPRFAGATPSNPQFAPGAFGGRYVLLAFLPRRGPEEQAALAALAAHRRLFDDTRISAFGVLRDPAAVKLARDQVGLRWLLDPDEAVSRLFCDLDGQGQVTPQWVLLDPNEVILARAGLNETEAFFDAVRALPDPADHAGAPLTAPVLLVPRVFEPDLCRRLIALYEREGGQPSGVAREIDGRTVNVVDGFKSRRDAVIQDEGLKHELNTRLSERLAPLVRKAFQYRASRIERYIVACYDAAEDGRFLPHRDDTTPATAHRRFACSINLNAEDFEGGDLRFPEFGPRTYRPPTGGAVVFSCSLLHEATPVTAGRRYAFLPFLYDDAAEAVRSAYLRQASEADT
ncbi:2OG-Fe(II) oxygenase [Phenylobacterium sp.]|uniref:2OG-Fe(II) oxygenase n=1 Tax=Phenylobacterium sp. TaxID=1871053 RepID=UPI002735B395|nr:2OG-Fe(II) oxygenase [Phenylobacterium sp.]MDP3855317.1 2OG-Fe(II) oxygenase [Phenylobacterium sp.]